MYSYDHAIPLASSSGSFGTTGTAGAFTAFIAGSSGTVAIQTIYGESITIPVVAGVIYPIRCTFLTASSAGNVIGLK
jgi:hypothetical protein